MKTLIALAALLFCQNAYPADFYLLKLVTDQYPDYPYQIGVATNEKNQLKEILFNTAWGAETRFQISNLARSKTVMSLYGYPVVKLAATPPKENSTRITMDYLNNAYNIFDSRDKKSITVQFNIRTGRYEIIDSETGRVITYAYAVTNYCATRQCGIKEIQLR